MSQQRVKQMIKSAEGSARSLPQDHEALSMERRSTDLEEGRRGCKVFGPLWSKEERMVKAMTVRRKRAERGGQALEKSNWVRSTS